MRKMTALLGAEAEPFLASLASPLPGLRVNTLKLTPELFEEISPFSLMPLPFPAAGYAIRGDEGAGKHPYHAAGLYYLQDPGAMAVAPLLDPRPGERVLDLSAAPGGKATHIASLMQGEGVLIANDVQPTRARELAGNLERMGVRNSIVTCESAERLAHHFGAWFDRVLVDAPCSGESMFAKSEAARSDWSPATVSGCARRQSDLLETAARLVRPGGVLLYSTCTFSPEENEQTVGVFLEREDGFEPMPMTAIPGADSGRSDWATGFDPSWFAGSLRLWPHRVVGAGHFIAGFRRREGEQPEDPMPGKRAIPAAAEAMLRPFREESLDLSLDAQELTLIGEEMFAQPAVLPDLRGLRVTRPGLWIGSLAGNRFEPVHALAMAARDPELRDPVALRLADPSTMSYLRGETLRSEGRPGWRVVTVDGFPLGWGKRVGTTVKNHYPKGLRRR